MTDVKMDLKSLRAKRGHLKRVITVTLKSLQQEGVKPEGASDYVTNIQQKLKEVEEYDLLIATELPEHEEEGDAYDV